MTSFQTHSNQTQLCSQGPMKNPLSKIAPFVLMIHFIAFLFTLTFLAEDLAHSRCSGHQTPSGMKHFLLSYSGSSRWPPSVSPLRHCFGWCQFHDPSDWPRQWWYKGSVPAPMLRTILKRPPKLQNPTEHLLRPSLGYHSLTSPFAWLVLLPFTPSTGADANSTVHAILIIHFPGPKLWQQVINRYVFHEWLLYSVSCHHFHFALGTHDYSAALVWLANGESHFWTKDNLLWTNCKAVSCFLLV